MVESLAITGARAQSWADGWRRLVLAAGMLVYPAVTAASINQHVSGIAATAGYGIVVVFAACYIAAMLSVRRDARPAFWILLVVMGALFVAELWFARIDAFYLCAVVVSLAVLPLRARVIPVVVVAAAAGLIGPVLIPSWHSEPGWTQAVMIVFTALLWYAFVEIARANQDLVESRAEVARLASESERNRIARDLHDLVGHSLTAITVKSNLARQLAAQESSPALREITEVEQLSRQALADVRAAVSGYREVTVASELARARELLRASGIVADIPTAVEPFDAATQELFGWAVREGVTNVVKHARATRCSVTLSPTAVEIIDDGTAIAAIDGNGLTGLRERAQATGASVTAGPARPGGWRLRVFLADGLAP
jgi:two-component system, NarL family, sensor histidine kinase DesK